ncbi:MAG TPA: hypothetical protein VN426_15855 [Syntrophomonadaceae bacterium]|nr:hypothetical protein [Syntrophomonadaceae bacterium]
MKKFLICAAICVVILVTLYSLLYEPVDVSFAENITLKYDHGTKNINMQITDQNDVNELKQICNGKVFRNVIVSEIAYGEPSCGFGTAEIIFEGHGKKISLFPACDGCDTMRFNLTNKYYYIGNENRRRLVDILGKYGATFPCE